MTRKGKSGTWSWTDTYPGKRAVTLLLDPVEADELLDQASEEGRLVANGVILGAPAIAFGAVSDEANEPIQVTISGNPSPETRDALLRTAEKAAEQIRAFAPPSPAPEPDGKIVILPVIRRERIEEPAQTDVETSSNDLSPRFEGCSILAEKPPRRPSQPAVPERRWNPVKGRWERRGEISAEDMRMVAEAVADGKVTICPPCTFALDANDVAETNWRKNPKSKAKRR